MTSIVYFHGFNSAGEGSTVQLLRNAVPDVSIVSPTYPCDKPLEAAILLESTIDRVCAQDAEVLLVGTSLGGYWARYFAATKNMPCLQINPAIQPHTQLAKYLGPNVNFATNETYVFEEVALAGYELLSSKAQGRKAAVTPRAIIFSGDKVINVPQTYGILKIKGDNVLLVAGGEHRVTEQMITPVVHSIRELQKDTQRLMVLG